MKTRGKKRRFINLRDPQLRALRLNLRIILERFYFDQLTFLKARWHGEIWKGGSRDAKKQLLNEIEGLTMKFKRSIVVCAICNKTEGDRVFVPRLDMWFCKDCFDKGFIPSKRDIP